jgi:hypothetical protein
VLVLVSAALTLFIIAYYRCRGPSQPAVSHSTPLPTAGALASAVSGASSAVAELVCRRYRRPIGGGVVEEVAGVLIGPHMFLTVGHFFCDAPSTFMIKRFPVVKGLKITPRALEFHMTDVQLLSSDLALVHDRDLHVYDADVRIGMRPRSGPCTLVLYQMHAERPDVSMVSATYMENFGVWRHASGRTFGGGSATPMFVVPGLATPGACGSFLADVTEDGVWTVFAVLVAQHPSGHMGFAPITQEVMDAAKALRERLADAPSRQSIRAFARSNQITINSGGFHPSSALVYAEPDAAVYIGRYSPEHSGSGDCTMVPTSFATLATQAGSPDTFARPRSKPIFDPECGYSVGLSTKWVQGANAATNSLRGFLPELGLVQEEFARIVEEAHVPHARPATLREAVNGLRPHYRGIVRKTSAGGLIESGPKSDHLVPAVCEHYPDGVTPTPAMAAEVERITNLWLQGVHYPVHSRLGPKNNEVRPLNKPIARSINCVPMAFTIAFRALFEPLNAILRNVEELRFLIGKNIVGKFAGVVKGVLSRFNSEVFFDADAFSFDLSHQWFMKDVLSGFYDVVARAAGYTVAARRAMKQALADAFTAYMTYKGDLWLAVAALISGLVGTGELQTLASWLLVRLAFVLMRLYPTVGPLLPDRTLRDAAAVAREVFSSFVSYHGGDDVLGAMKPGLAHTYDALVFAAWMRLAGYIFTSDTDKTKPPDNAPWGEVGVYKRTFLVVEGERVFARLNLKSIAKMLHWRDSRCAVSPAEQEASILETAQREFFLHGRAVFDEWTQHIVRMAKACHLNVRLATYEDLLDRFDRGVLKTWAHEHDEDWTTGGQCGCYPWDPSLISACVSAQTPETITAAGSNEAVEDAVPGVCMECATVSRPPLDGVLPGVSEYWKRVCIYNGTWTAGYTSNFFPIGVWMADAVLAAKTNYLYGGRFTVNVDVTTTNPASYSGVLAIGLAPYNSNVGSAGVTACNIVSLDSFGLLDVALCNRVHLSIPFFGWSQFYTMQSSSITGQLAVLCSVAELQPVIASNGSPSLNPLLTFHIYFTDVEAYIPTTALTVSGTHWSDEAWAVSGRSKPGKVTAFRSTTASNATKTKNPGVGATLGEYAPDATVASVVKAGLAFTNTPALRGDVAQAFMGKGVKPSDLLRLFGFSSPSALPDITYMVPRPWPFFSTGESHDSSVKLTVSPTASQSADRTGVEGRSGDALAFENVFRRWGFVGNGSIPSGTASGTIALRIPVHPFVMNTAGQFAPVALSTFTFDKWTGDLEYWLYISSTSFDRGRIAIYWLSASSYASPSLALAMTAVNPLVVDLSGSRSIKLTVPWGYSQPWISSFASGNAALPPSFTSNNGWTSNGWLVCQVMEPLVSTTATPPTRYISVMVRAGKNFRVCDPTLAVSTYWYCASGVFQERVAEEVSCAFPGVVIPDDELLDTAAEMEVSYRSLLHRRVLNFWFNVSTIITTGGAQAFFVPLQDPPVLPRLTPRAGYNYFPTYQGILSMCFAGWRGSTRHTALMRFNVGAATASVVPYGRAFIRRTNRDEEATPSIFTQTTYSPYTYNANYYVGVDMGADMAQAGNLMSQPLSVDVPYISYQMLQTVGTPVTQTNPGCALVVDMVATQVPAAMVVEDYASVGDDYQLYGWTGMPTLVQATPPTSPWAPW